MTSVSTTARDIQQQIQAGSIGELHIHGLPEAPSRVVLLPPFKKKPYDLVGRDALIEKVCAALKGGFSIIALLHLPGVGKTTLAAHLAKSRTIAELFPDGILWAHLGLAPDVRGQLRKWAHALEMSEARMKDFETLEQWREAVSSAIGTRRMLLVIDDVWDSAVGEQMLVGGESCAHLVTTRYEELASDIAHIWYEVGKLEQGDGLALLSRLAPDAVAAEPEAAAELVDTVDGLPLALVLMGYYLRKEGASGQSGRIRAALATLHDIDMRYSLSQPDEYPSDTPRSLALVIESSYRELGRVAKQGSKFIGGEQLREALKQLCILRPDPARFTRALASHVTGLPGGALHELCASGLVEAMRIKPRADDPAGGERFAIHRTIGEYLCNKLTQDERRALHLRVAEYYRDQLRERDEKYQSSATDYKRWYRYEDLDWQDCKDNWLFHMARAGEYDTVKFAFLLAWFDAFWWWGCFLEFNFCDQLLREWRQRTTRPESERGLKLLAQFKDAYPRETENRYGGDWRKAEEVLREVRRSEGLEGDPALIVDAEHCRLRGLTSIFLAETQRFGQRDTAAAERWYRDALAMFRQHDDKWDESWTLYHLADLLTDCGRHAEADTLCIEAIRLARKQDDPEVQALLACVQAEAALSRHDTGAATQLFHHAVLQAYRFQVDPQAPDPYTIRFYPLVAQRVARRLQRLHTDDADQATSIVYQLQTLWCPEAAGLVTHPAWFDAPVEQVVAAVFPQALAAETLADQEQVRCYAEQVAATLSRLTASHNL